jgi:pSer/pThr/pTyr-binding forkhead associated (FHA) protein
MYKLVVVAGKKRGEEYVLEEGDNVLGRDAECEIHFPVPGVSKKHMNITVTDDTCYVQDLGSSNGTFLNGKAIKRATAKNGDKIALPDTIIQIVHVEEKKVFIKKRVSSDDEEDDFMDPPPVPEILPQKILWGFKHKVMPAIHGFNEEYEWMHILAVLLSLFCVITISLVIFPVLNDSKDTLLAETSYRGELYADAVSLMNRKHLVNRDIDKVNVTLIKSGMSGKGVEDFRLFDMEGRIVRPVDKLNQQITDPFYVNALQWANSPKSIKKKVIKLRLRDDYIGVAKVITALDSRKAKNLPVGVIALKFKPVSLENSGQKSQKEYLEALVTTALVAIVFFGVLYFITIRHFDEINWQTEEALRGRRKSLESRWLMKELDPLRNTINALLQRIRELNREDEGEFMEEEGDEGYVRTLYEFMQGANGPVMVLDSQKNLAHLNMEAEDLTGIRESASQGMSLLDVAREKGLAATMIELCDNSANNNGTLQQGEYDLAGVPQTINITSLIGKDGFAKSFYITFVRAD